MAVGVRDRVRVKVGWVDARGSLPELKKKTKTGILV